MKWGTAIIIFKVWISTLKIEISNALNIDLNRYVTISGSILYISYSICLGLLFFQVMKNMTLNLAMFCKMSIWEWFWGLTHTLLSFNGLILETKELSTWIFKTRPYKLCIIMNYFFLLYGSYAIKSKLKWYIIYLNM